MTPTPKAAPFGTGGFCLVDIMIAVLIFALLLSLAIPAFQKARNPQQVETHVSP